MTITREWEMGSMLVIELMMGMEVVVVLVISWTMTLTGLERKVKLRQDDN